MSRFLTDHYDKLTAYTPGEQPKDGEYIKLNTNESPFPPAPQVVDAIGKIQIESLRLYPDPTCAALKAKIARLYEVNKECVFLANGSDDILNFAFMAFSERGAAFADITYGFYKVFAELHGVPYEEIPLKDDFSIDPLDYVGKNKLIALANPNAPSGKALTLEQIETVLKGNIDSVVLVDEAYVDFGAESALPLLRKYDNLLVVRTFSKSRCLAGGRLGYAFASREIIEDLEKIKYSTNPYLINTLTQKAGIATVDAESYYMEKCKEIMSVREYTTEKLQELGFEVVPSSTNFVFAKHPKIGGEKLYQELKARRILVRHFSGERIKEYNRITIGTKEQMDKLLEITEEILGGLSE